ncbi:MAG: acetate/propionate family kinase [Alphaproteobacteria bacterium]|nr:acetate/propionate family kinase [Alphaproteobacteria bacterium]
MKILVLNAGSSSIKLSLFDTYNDTLLFKCIFERFKNDGCTLVFFTNNKKESKKLTFSTTIEVFENLEDILKDFDLPKFDAVGHRVVHGGDKFINTAIIDDVVLKQIDECTNLAPLHNPLNLAGVKAARKIWPEKPHIAVFDTAFHHTIPEQAYSYAVPKKWRDAGVRRYGFHGASHKYIATRTAQEFCSPVTNLRIISCHLGNGASICAIDRGFSVDTSMGMTALEGLVMGTRCGDVDPGIFNFLNKNMGMSLKEIENALYNESGLKGLSGIGNDLRDIEKAAMDGNHVAQLAIGVYAYRVRKYIGAYAAVLQGVDALTFTGGIGQNSAIMRRRICDGLEFLGLDLDDDKNISVDLGKSFDAPQIQRVNSRIKVFVTRTREELMIAKETWHILTKENKVLAKKKKVVIPVSVSARHVHLDKKTMEALFGKGYELKPLKQLSQPGVWAAEETITIVGTKGNLKNVRILGPLRKATQIEISRTDTFALGVEAPVRSSGDLEGTPVVNLIGSKGEIKSNGLIIAKRHIHITVEDAERLKLKNGDFVDISIDSEGRDIIFGDTLVRVSDKYVTEMHIDTDEANAAGVSLSTNGELIYVSANACADIIGKQNL